MSGRLGGLVCLVFSLIGCEERVAVDLSAVPTETIEQGARLMPVHCHTCHGVGELEIDAMLAPPLWGIRAHYLGHFTEPEAFVDVMTAFILEPQVDKSRLPLAVAHYGLKAPVSLTEAEIRSVVWAIYAGQLERPLWLREYRKRHRDCEASW